jgi:plasmid stabilization system protein ParE
MAYALVIQPKAIFELKEAFDWYEEQNYGLGYEFIDEIEACYRKICAHPERYPPVNSLYRRIKANRFPYLIVYEIEKADVIVNSVRHLKRQPM